MKTKLNFQFLSIITILSMLITIPRPALAEGLTINVPTPEYPTVQAAINAASAGDSINIAAGTYVENIVVDESVTIIGAGQGSTVIMPAVSSANPCTGSSLCGGAASNVFLVQADNVVIHDLTVDGDNPALTSGIVRTGSGAPADLDARNGIIKNTNATYNGLEVYNVTVQNIYLRGIYSTAGSFNFHNNTVTNVQGDSYSIAMFAWGGPGTMANNTVSYANDGISANHSNGIQFLNNTISHSGSGVHTDNSGDGGGVADLIQGNMVSDCIASLGGYGIWTFVPYLAPTVDGNTITNCDVGLSAWGQGAAVVPQFTNNTVTGPAKKVGSVGAYITTDLIGWGYADVSVNFAGNVITNYETGVYLTADQQSWNAYPYEAKTINVTFHSNQIFGNTNGVDKGTGGTIINDFARNWWGAATGPSGIGPGSGDSIADGVGFAPWCTNAACTTFSATFPPPVLPSSFYGEIHFNDGVPSLGAIVEAYLPGGNMAASTTITTYDGKLVYSFDIPGTAENEGDTITFKINGRVVATSTWHSGTHIGLNLHPPQALPGGPYSGDAGSAINFIASANDWGMDVAAYQWDWDNDGTFDTTGQNVTHTWADFGTYTVGLKVTDSQGGVGTATVDVTVNKISASITLSNLAQTYDGAPKPVTVTTTPAGLGFSVTYDSSTTVPTNAGEYAIVATITDPNYTGSASGTLTVAKADTVTSVSGGGTFVYDGAPHAATVSVTGAGGLNLTPSPVYSGSCSAAPVNVSDTPCTASFLYTGDTNHNGSTASATITITPKPVIVTVTAGQSKIFGAVDPLFAYTSDALIGTDSFTGTLSRETGENVGTYAITQGTLTAGNNYLINFAPANFSIASASATVTLSDLNQTYDGTPKPVTVTTSPAGLSVSITYDGFTTAPTNAGSYAVIVTITDPNHAGTASGTLVINKAVATIVLSGLSHVYDGTPKSATATTTPAGLNVDITYNGSATVPTNAGSYAVAATVNDANYGGSASGTLVILAKHDITLVPGWNLVSFNVHPTNTSIASVLTSVSGNFDLVYAWDATGAHPGSGNWLKYDNIPFSADSLTNLDETMGFWIHMTAADTLEVTGNIPTATSITLSDNAGGWNLVGYPSAAGGVLPGIMNGVGSDFSLIYAYHANDAGDPWKLYDLSSPFPIFNDLHELAAGWGYWVKVSADHTWSVQYVMP